MVKPSAEPVLLLEGLGKHHFPISSDGPMAQRYFDQGLILSYGFNHAEAARSFLHVKSWIRPARCVIGVRRWCLVLISMRRWILRSFLSLCGRGKALALKDQATDKESALIQALAMRYSKEVVSDRSPLDVAYAEAMRGVAKQFPDDPAIGALLAEALMDLHPWDFWSKGGDPKPWTPEIVSTLEAVLDNPPVIPWPIIFTFMSWKPRPIRTRLFPVRNDCLPLFLAPAISSTCPPISISVWAVIAMLCWPINMLSRWMSII